MCFCTGGYDGGSRPGGGGGGGDRGSSGRDDFIVQEDTIFISGMSPSLTEDDVRDHFGAIGIIKVCR